MKNSADLKNIHEPCQMITNGKADKMQSAVTYSLICEVS